MKILKTVLSCCVVLFICACAHTPQTYVRKAVFLDYHYYPGGYSANYRISDKDIARLHQVGIKPIFQITDQDLKKLYPAYAPKADAPLVGILFNREDGDYAIPETYVYSVIKSGARVRILSFDDIASQVDGLDAILLTGGDFDWPTELFLRLQDKKYPAPGKRYYAYEQLLNYAMEKDLPVLGICAGQQAMSFILGKAKLYEDLTYVTVKHHRNIPGFQVAHMVKPVPGSRLAGIVGEAELPVNSRHFQGVVPSSIQGNEKIKVTAWSPDGVIEAVEFTDFPKFLAVQFHPEVLAWKGHKRHQQIFDAFVQDAMKSKTKH